MPCLEAFSAHGYHSRPSSPRAILWGEQSNTERPLYLRAGDVARATRLHFQTRQHPGVLFGHGLKRLRVEVEGAQDSRGHLFRPHMLGNRSMVKRRIGNEQRHMGIV